MRGEGEGGVTSYDGLYGESPLEHVERATLVRLQVYKGGGISRAELYERELEGKVCHLGFFSSTFLLVIMPFHEDCS